MTERGRCRFTVKEGELGRPFLALEPAGGSLGILGRGHLSLDLADGTTLEDAKALATTLNGSVAGIAYTA